MINRGKLSVWIIGIVLFSLLLLFPCAVFSSTSSLNVFHDRFPDLYIHARKISPAVEPFDYSLNQHQLEPTESTEIESVIENTKYVLIIDHSGNYSDRSAEGKKNHFLLELANYFENKPELLFSILLNEDIRPFNLNRENILSMQASSSKKIRLYDALLICNQQIKTKYANHKTVILMIGSGINAGNIENSFMPYCPIVYFHPENTELKDSFLAFMILASGGSILQIPDNIRIPLLLSESINKNPTEIQEISHFLIPWKLYRNKNLFQALGPNMTNQVVFHMPSHYRLFLFIALVLLILATLCLIKIFWKKKVRKNKEKKLHHEYSTAFLVISHKSERFEKRISRCEFVIGSAPLCDCIIDDFDLSSTHCMIKENNGSHDIIDLKSRNGVYVNGKKTQHCLLSDEDVIVIGSSCLIYKKGPISYVSEKKIL